MWTYALMCYLNWSNNTSSNAEFIAPDYFRFKLLEMVKPPEANL